MRRRPQLLRAPCDDCIVKANPLKMSVRKETGKAAHKAIAELLKRFAEAVHHAAHVSKGLRSDASCLRSATCDAFSALDGRACKSRRGAHPGPPSRTPHSRLKSTIFHRITDLVANLFSRRDPNGSIDIPTAQWVHIKSWYTTFCGFLVLSSAPKEDHLKNTNRRFYSPHAMRNLCFPGALTGTGEGFSRKGKKDRYEIEVRHHRSMYCARHTSDRTKPPRNYNANFEHKHRTFRANL